VTYVAAGPILNPANTQSGGAVRCPSGLIPLSGGVQSDSFVAGEQSVNTSQPFASSGNTPDGWLVFVDNTSTTAQSFIVFAVCAPATAVVTSKFTVDDSRLKR
jgi:hypothetical protein